MSANLEEAAAIAAEYISNLDNLPAEVQHLLSELRHRDIRVNELQQEINKESAKYIRHSLRTSQGNTGQTLSAKDTLIPQNVSAHYEEIDRLSEEKIALAARVVQLIERARAKLDFDVNKMLKLQGQLDTAAQSDNYWNTPGKLASDKITDSLRNALAIPDTPLVPPPSISAPPPRKKQKIGPTVSTGGIKLPSPAPMPPATHTAPRVSRLHLQINPRQSPHHRSRRVTPTPGPDAEEDEDAEGEEDPDEGGDAEDKELYCFCQKLSYGEMIACDNPDCRYQWFHLPCVNLKPPLPENWFCADCLSNMKKGTGSVNTGRKGRKK